MTADVSWLLERERFDDLPVVLRFVFDGEPVSKARARFTGQGSKVRAYTPERTRTAEERIERLARAEGLVGSADGDHSFGLFAKFFCGTWQRRDVDNMLKLVSDALTGIVWVDDAQVSEMSATVERGVDDPRSHVLVYQTRASRPPMRPCEVCGAPVRQYKSQPNRYCSKAHSDEGQRVQIPLTCTVCGTVYTLARARANRVKTPFCSDKCRRSVQTVTRPCLNCGTPVTRPKSWTKKETFCGVPCFKELGRKEREAAS